MICWCFKLSLAILDYVIDKYVCGFAMLDEITKKHVDDLSFDAIFNPASTETRPIKNIVDSSQIFQEVNKRQPTETKECRMVSLCIRQLNSAYCQQVLQL